MTPEQRFDKKFVNQIIHGGFDSNEIKQFILSEITLARKEVLKEVKSIFLSEALGSKSKSWEQIESSIKSKYNKLTKNYVKTN